MTKPSLCFMSDYMRLPDSWSINKMFKWAREQLPRTSAHTLENFTKSCLYFTTSKTFAAISCTRSPVSYLPSFIGRPWCWVLELFPITMLGFPFPGGRSPRNRFPIISAFLLIRVQSSWLNIQRKHSIQLTKRPPQLRLATTMSKLGIEGSLCMPHRLLVSWRDDICRWLQLVSILLLEFTVSSYVPCWQLFLLGGAIGAGLFVGSGSALATGGPGSLVRYISLYHSLQ